MGRLIFFAWLLLFPQLLGVLLFFRLRRLPTWLARVLSAVAPSVTFVFLAPIFLFAGIREAQMRGERCGMPAFAALTMLFAGTIFELIIGLSVQIFISASSRTKLIGRHG